MDRFIPQFKRQPTTASVAGVLAALALTVVLIPLGNRSLIYAGDHAPVPHPVAEQAFQPNPFPDTPTMTDTVQLVLDQYLGRQPIAPPAIDDARLMPFSGHATVHIPTAHRTTRDKPAPTPPPPPPAEHADIALTVWPEPSIRVMRGARLTYELRLTNYAEGDANQMRVLLPYNRQQLRLVASSLDGTKGDWVSRVTDREVEVTFGSLDGKAGRTGRLVFEVAATLSNDTILDMRPSATWWDDQGEMGPSRANWAPVLIGDGPATGPWVWTQVTPEAGAAGTTHTFLSNRFIPGEGIITWLNTPSGVKALDLRGSADSQGVTTLAFASSGLTPGSYQLVLYGARSGLTGVATFVVR